MRYFCRAEPQSTAEALASDLRAELSSLRDAEPAA